MCPAGCRGDSLIPFSSLCLWGRRASLQSAAHRLWKLLQPRDEPWAAAPVSPHPPPPPPAHTPPHFLFLSFLLSPCFFKSSSSFFFVFIQVLSIPQSLLLALLPFGHAEAPASRMPGWVEGGAKRPGPQRSSLPGRKKARERGLVSPFHPSSLSRSVCTDLSTGRPSGTEVCFLWSLLY